MLRNLEKRIERLEERTKPTAPVYRFCIGEMDEELQQEVEQLEEAGERVICFQFDVIGEEVIS